MARPRRAARASWSGAGSWLRRDGRNIDTIHLPTDSPSRRPLVLVGVLLRRSFRRCRLRVRPRRHSRCGWSTSLGCGGRRRLRRRLGRRLRLRADRRRWRRHPRRRYCRSDRPQGWRWRRPCGNWSSRRLHPGSHRRRKLGWPLTTAPREPGIQRHRREPNGPVALDVLADGQNKHEQEKTEQQENIDQRKALKSSILRMISVIGEPWNFDGLRLFFISKTFKITHIGGRSVRSERQPKDAQECKTRQLNARRHRIMAQGNRCKKESSQDEQCHGRDED